MFHVAAWYKVGVHEPLADQINVDGTRNVLKTMRTLEIPRGVYTSTVAVFSDTKGAVPDETYRYDGPHLSHYDRTKWIAHYRVALPKMADGLPLIDRHARAGLRPRRHQRHAHRAGRPAARPAADDARPAPRSAGRTSKTPPAATSWPWRRARPGETYIITGPRHTFEYAFDVAAKFGEVRRAADAPGAAHHAQRWPR